MWRISTVVILVAGLLATGKWMEAAKGGKGGAAIKFTWDNGNTPVASASVTLCSGLLSCNTAVVCDALSFDSKPKPASASKRTNCWAPFEPQSYQYTFSAPGASPTCTSGTIMLPQAAETTCGTNGNGTVSLLVSAK